MLLYKVIHNGSKIPDHIFKQSSLVLLIEIKLKAMMAVSNGYDFEAASLCIIPRKHLRKIGFEYDSSEGK